MCHNALHINTSSPRVHLGPHTRHETKANVSHALNTLLHQVYHKYYVAHASSFYSHAGVQGNDRANLYGAESWVLKERENKKFRQLR